MHPLVTHLLDGFDNASARAAGSKRAAYLWCLWSLLCLLAVITGAGGIECLAVGLVSAMVGVRRLHVITTRDHQADLESWQADTRDADVSWWLDRLRYSDLPQERVVARGLLAYWGVRSHINPLESEDDRCRRAERVKAKHEAADRKVAARGLPETPPATWLTESCDHKRAALFNQAVASHFIKHVH